MCNTSPEFTGQALAALPRPPPPRGMPSDAYPAAPQIPAKASLSSANSSSSFAHQPSLPAHSSSSSSIGPCLEMRQSISEGTGLAASQLAQQVATDNSVHHGQQQPVDAAGAPLSQQVTAMPAPGYATSKHHEAAGRQVAARMHVLRAQAMDKAWQHQQQRLFQQHQAPISAKVRHGTAPVTEAATSICSRPLSSSSTAVDRQFAGYGSKPFPDPNAAVQQRLEQAVSTPLPSEPLAELHDPPQQQQQQQNSAVCRPVDLSAETESLVVKLRALSSDRHTGLPSAKAKTAVVPQQGFLYKPKVSKRRRQDAPELPASHASTAVASQPAILVHRSHMPPADASMSSAPSAAPFSRCSSNTSSQPRIKEASSNRGFLPAAPSSSHTEGKLETADLTCGVVGSFQPPAKAAQSTWESSRSQPRPVQRNQVPSSVQHITAEPAEDNIHEDSLRDLQGPPVKHRLGQVTPLKSSFTPRPSRFRLEAERCSPFPCSPSDHVQQALFSSPVRQHECTAQLEPVSENPSVAQTATALSESYGRGWKDQAMHSGCRPEDAAAAVAAADRNVMQDSAARYRLEVPSAKTPVFNEMHFILDPGFLPEQQHRYCTQCLYLAVSVTKLSYLAKAPDSKHQHQIPHAVASPHLDFQ